MVSAEADWGGVFTERACDDLDGVGGDLFVADFGGAFAEYDARERGGAVGG